MKKLSSIVALLVLIITASIEPARAQVLPLREQAAVINNSLKERFDKLLPALMDSTGIDMWVLISREYNEDPILKTMLPAEWLSARRRTILVFYRKGTELEKLAIARYNVGSQIKASWNMEKFPDQWDALVNLIQSRAPQKIGINTCEHQAHADGLDHTEYTQFMAKLPAALKSRVVSAEDLGIRWLETRTDFEMNYYPQLINISHKIIAEGFSEKVITPGITTTDDLVWWYRNKIRSLGLDTWFQPSVDIQRKGAESNLILPGDLLHVDFGISYLRLQTDIQEHAYVLQPGEKEAPAFLVKAFAQGNRLQDILTGNFAYGRTGNQILKASLEQAKKEGLTPSIYTHPIGFHGHAAGTTIGMWDMQGGVPGAGDYPMHYNTAYSIELNCTVQLPEWNKNIRIMLEQDGFFNEKGFRYIDGRQKEIYLIPRPATQIGN
ncbi:MAG: aminopeptidase P family protein [Bacteroidetes bacterium]|nr:aminopeptidase P family protein [Bacteroidota bacterium]